MSAPFSLPPHHPQYRTPLAVVALPLNDGLHSWIGSVNIFIVLAGGFISGRLHDRGYLYVIFPPANLGLMSCIPATR
jgi:hypothetical protein